MALDVLKTYRKILMYNDLPFVYHPSMITRWLVCGDWPFFLKGTDTRFMAETKGSPTRALVVAALLIAPAFAQKLAVKIINRQNNDTDYSYVVPGYSTSNSKITLNCLGDLDSVNCRGSSSTTSSTTPAQQVSYHVRGATFSLQLPDGRIAVVNCEGKVGAALVISSVLFGAATGAAAGAAGTPPRPPAHRRSCRMPLVDDIQAEFDGDKAKLNWPVSIDGKKLESETYKILAVLAKN